MELVVGKSGGPTYLYQVGLHRRKKTEKKRQGYNFHTGNLEIIVVTGEKSG